MLDALLSRLAVPSVELLRSAASRSPCHAPVLDVSPSDAQSLVNFVVLVPSPRSEEEEELSGTLRVEAAYGTSSMPLTGRPTASTCSYRFEWQAHPQLRVRCLQKLPEFPNLVPLATLHPAAGAGRLGSVFSLSGGRAGWIGVDSLQRRIASFLSHGTLVHVAVLPGYHVLDEQLIAALAQLAPLSTAAVRAVEATPYADLTYFSRYTRPYAECTQTRPSSLFQLRWPLPTAGAHTWSSDIAIAEYWFGYPPGGGELGRGAKVSPPPPPETPPRETLAHPIACLGVLCSDPRFFKP